MPDILLYGDKKYEGTDEVVRDGANFERSIVLPLLGAQAGGWPPAGALAGARCLLPEPQPAVPRML